MKRVIVAMQNTLVGEVVAYSLKKRDMLVENSRCDSPESVANVCGAFLADVLFMDVTRFGGGDLENRLQTVESVKKSNPNVKVCLVCDKVSDAELAYKVANAKAMGQIDAFFYQSVPSDYIADVVSTL